MRAGLKSLVERSAVLCSFAVSTDRPDGIRNADDLDTTSDHESRQSVSKAVMIAFSQPTT